jgi:hypothetical protein
MLNWQYKTILAEIQQVELHESGDCPCVLSDLEPPEKCIGKHTLNVFSLCNETANMDSRNTAMLREIAEQASDYHDKFKDFVCHTGDLPELREWARTARKKLEPIYYTCKVPKAKLREPIDFTDLIAKLSERTEKARLEETAVKIAGKCEDKTCSFKVTATDKETAGTSSIKELGKIIDQVQSRMKTKTRATSATYALGSSQLNRYEFQYRIVDGSKLIVSHDPFTFATNPDYPQELQPRLRGRAATQLQVERMAANLDPAALLTEFHSVDRGAPIIYKDMVVESGNGRVMAILRSAKEHPEVYAQYKESLRAIVPGYSLNPEDVDKLTMPVLVRERCRAKGVKVTDKRTAGVSEDIPTDVKEALESPEEVVV